MAAAVQTVGSIVSIRGQILVNDSTILTSNHATALATLGTEIEAIDMNGLPASYRYGVMKSAIAGTVGSAVAWDVAGGATTLALKNTLVLADATSTAGDTPVYGFTPILTQVEATKYGWFGFQGDFSCICETSVNAGNMALGIFTTAGSLKELANLATALYRVGTSLAAVSAGIALCRINLTW